MFNDILHEWFLATHSVDNEESLKELFLILVACKCFCCSLSTHCVSAVADVLGLRFLGSLFLFEQRVRVFNRNKFIFLLLEGLGVVVGIEKVFRCEELHEAPIDVVLHVPHPFSAECDAKLGTNS